MGERNQQNGGVSTERSVTIDSGYSAMTGAWPTETHSPTLNQDEMMRVRRRFSVVYADARDDLKGTDLQDDSDVGALIEIVGRSNTADNLLSLRNSLLVERPLRGRISLVTTPVKEGHLGSIDEALQVAVGVGGAIGILAGAVVQWVRQQSTDVKVKVSIGNRSAEVQAKRVKALRPEDVEAYISDLTESLINATDDPSRAIEGRPPIEFDEGDDPPE